MSGQLPSTLQFPTRQNPGGDTMQFWPQNSMYKHLEELQRQQQFWQRGQELKRQSSAIHMPVMAKPMSASHFPTLINAVPLVGTSNYPLQNEFSVCNSKGPITSQMLTSNSMNMSHGMMPSAIHGSSNGVMLTSNQGQLCQRIGFLSQQCDRSLYGLPIPITGGSLSQNSQVQGVPQQFPDLMAKASINQTANSFQGNYSQHALQSFFQDSLLVSNQDVQRKSLSGHSPENGALECVSGNAEQMNQTIGTLNHELYMKQERLDLQEDFHDTKGSQGCSQLCSGLDPTEKKILFGSDDDSTWATAFGMDNGGIGFSHGNACEKNVVSDSFPSTQSGTWSAFMQSAIAEVSSGEMGMLDEPKSNLSVQKTETNCINSLPRYSDQVKCQMKVDLLQRGSPLPPKPASAFASDHTHANTPKSTANLAHGQCGGVQVDTEESRESFVGSNPPNVHNFLSKQQIMHSYAPNFQFGKSDNLNVTDSHSSSVETPINVSSIESLMQHGPMNDSMQAMHIERMHGMNMCHADSGQVACFSNLVVGQGDVEIGDNYCEVGTTGFVDSSLSSQNKENKKCGSRCEDILQQKQALLDSSSSLEGRENRGNNQRLLNKGIHPSESSLGNLEKTSGETYGKVHVHVQNSQKETSTDSCILNYTDHSSDSGVVAKTGHDSITCDSGNQKSRAQVGHMTDSATSPRHQYPLVGNLGFFPQMNDCGNQVAGAQSLSMVTLNNLKSQKLGCVQHAVVANAPDVDENSVNDLQHNARRISDSPLKHDINRHRSGGLSYFNESALVLPQSKGADNSGYNPGHCQFETGVETRTWSNSVVVAQSSSNTQDESKGEDFHGHTEKEHLDEDDQREIASEKVEFSSLSSSSHPQEASSNPTSDGCTASELPTFLHFDQKEGKWIHLTSNPLKRQKIEIVQPHGVSIRPSVFLNQNSSLQLPSMVSHEVVSGKVSAKNMKEAELNLILQKTVCKVPQSAGAVFGHTDAARGKIASKLIDGLKHNTFSVDSKMLDFSSTGNENCSAKNGTCLGQNLYRGLKHSHISPQMAPSWFEQYGSPRSHTAMATHNSPGTLPINNKATAEQYLIPRVSGDTGIPSMVVESIDLSGSKWKSVSPANFLNGHSKLPQNLPTEVPDHNSISRPKKRKSVELVPWHKEITGELYWLQNMRVADNDWAQATDRLPEKGNYGNEMSGDRILSFWPRRRLGLMTKLMHQLLPALPAAFLLEPTKQGFEEVLYMVAKLGLGDACNLVSCLGNDVPGSSGAIVRSGTSRLFETYADPRLLNVVGNFAAKAKKLESDFLRFEKKASVVDVKVECQDIERLSIINHFAKYHSAIQKDGKVCVVETACRLVSQRGVEGLSVPCPEGVVCLSL